MVILRQLRILTHILSAGCFRSPAAHRFEPAAAVFSVQTCLFSFFHRFGACGVGTILIASLLYTPPHQVDVAPQLVDVIHVAARHDFSGGFIVEFLDSLEPSRPILVVLHRVAKRVNGIENRVATQQPAANAPTVSRRQQLGQPGQAL